MRLRHRKNLASRLQTVSGLFLDGGWETPRRAEVELGCGFGGFIEGKARLAPETSFVALERNADALVRAMERVQVAELPNVRFLHADAKDLRAHFAAGSVDRLYINFCEPWPARRHWARRLTHPGFLAVYREVLKPGGELFLKTDNRPLWAYSVKTLTEAGWTVNRATDDLHGGAERPPDDVWTEYERKFHGRGNPICRLEARV
jgi:tRNA (guanine-N7-)-methyltransferase